MLLRVKIIIVQWFLLFAFSSVNGVLVIKLDDDSEGHKEDVKHGKNHILNYADKRRDERRITNSIAARDKPILYRNKDVEGYRNKVLVKRIVPHGYKVNSLEYDDKYKTLYKPLVRIHKKEPYIEDNNENKIDLVYVIDDENGNNISKDDALFEPFSIDNMDIKSLSESDTYERDTKKYTDVNNLDWKELGNIHKLNSLSDGIMEYKTSYEYDIYKSLTELKKPQEKIKHNKVKKSVSNKHDSGPVRIQKHGRKVRHHNKIKTKKYAAEPIKLQWFGTVGQLVSKHFTIKDKKKKKFKKFKRDNSARLDPNKKLIILVKDLSDMDKRERGQNELKKLNTRDLFKWFGPIGQIQSKQFNRKDTYGNYQRSHEDNKNKLKQDMPASKDKSVSIQTEKEFDVLQDFNGIFKIQNSSIANYKKKQSIVKKSELSKWFGPIGGLNTNTESKPQSISNKYTLLDHINRLRADNVKKSEEKKLIEKIRELTENLRTAFDKSGEDLHLEQQARLPFWTFDEPTTAKTTSMMPEYPFWNYWTYEKTIHQDVCKGQTVLDGGICIGVP